MSIEFNGVNLTGDNMEKVHELARKIGISRSWLRLEGEKMYYDVICPFKRQAILNYLKKRKQ